MPNITPEQRAIIERFEKAVRANGYRTCDDATEAEYNAALSALSAALSAEAVAVKPAAQPTAEGFGLILANAEIERLNGVIAELNAMLTPAPAASEPVAYLRHDESIQTPKYVAGLLPGQQARYTPLYTHPAPAPAVEGEAMRIADAVLAWMVKYDLIDAGNEYRAEDVIPVLDDLAPAPSREGV